MYIRNRRAFFDRLLKMFGCPHPVCASGTTAGDAHTLGPPTLGMPLGPLGSTTSDLLRSQATTLLSRLLWYDKKQFRRFVCVLVNTRDVSFLLGFLHAFLGFCHELSNPHSPLPSTNSPVMMAGAATGEKSGNCLGKFFFLCFSA